MRDNDACPILNLTEDLLLDIFADLEQRDIGQLRQSCRALKQIIYENCTRLPRPLVSVSFDSTREKSMADDMDNEFLPRPKVFILKCGKSARKQIGFVARATRPHQILTEDIPFCNSKGIPTREVIACALRGIFAIKYFRVKDGYLNDDELFTINECLPRHILLEFFHVDLREVQLTTFCAIIKKRELSLRNCTINPSQWTATAEATNLLAETRASNSNYLTVQSEDAQYSQKQRASLLSRLLLLSLKYLDNDMEIFQRLPRGLCSSIIINFPTDAMLLNLWDIPHLSVDLTGPPRATLEGAKALADLYTEKSIAAKAKIYISSEIFNSSENDEINRQLKDAATWTFERGDFIMTIGHINGNRNNREHGFECNIGPIKKDSE